MRRERVKVGNKLVDAEHVEPTQTTERWNEYLMDDGTLLKVKLILKKTYRLLDQFDPQGNPVYLVESQNVLTVNPPDHLKRK